jgi:hypothetical protein
MHCSFRSVSEAKYVPPQGRKPVSPIEEEDDEQYDDGYELESCDVECCDKDCECDDCTRCASNSLNPYDEDHSNGLASAA